MDRDIELYRGYTISASALPLRKPAEGWGGSFVLSEGGAEIERISVAGPHDSETDAIDNARRVAKLRVDQLIDG